MMLAHPAIAKMCLIGPLYCKRKHAVAVDTLFAGLIFSRASPVFRCERLPYDSHSNKRFPTHRFTFSFSEDDRKQYQSRIGVWIAGFDMSSRVFIEAKACITPTLAWSIV